METSKTDIDFESLFKSVPDLYLVLNLKFEIVEVSEPYLKATMVKREDIIGHHIFEIFPDNPDDPLASGVNNLRASLERVTRLKSADIMAVQKYDIRRPQSEGGKFEVRYWSPINVPVFDENNELKYIIHRVEDVSDFINLQHVDLERKRVFSLLNSRFGEMQTEVYKRAQALQETNKRLRDNEFKLKMAMISAEKASQAKSEFLAAMSHEIRTPLNGVLGMIRLMIDTSLSVEQREFAEIIRISAESLLSIINNILDFSKIESGHIDSDKETFSLYGLIEDVVDVVFAHAYRKKISLGIYIEPSLPEFVIGDALKIRQVLHNLLSNAVKFTEKGEVTLKVQIQKNEEKQISLLFEVADTGIGIKPDVIKNLFQSFTQGDMSTSRKYGGTGLGLAISKRLVEFMGGKIGVESVPNIGSQFCFTLTLDKELEADNQAKPSIPKKFQNKKILCVDENVTQCEYIKKLLECWHLRCDKISDPSILLKIIQKSIDEGAPYSLIILDPNFTTQNGLELLAAVKKLESSASNLHFPILIMSPLGNIFTNKSLQNLKVERIIKKPFRKAKLFENILDIFNNNLDLTECNKSISNTQPNHKKNLHILLAEDNYINLQVITRFLSKFGYEADIVTNGEEAVAAYKTKPYDLILMDCEMPVKDGYAATREIRQLESTGKHHIPILAMTAHALQGDREKCINAGMDDYIPKPIEANLLAEKIAQQSKKMVY